MDISSVDHILTTTRSVRKRLDLTRPVEPEVVEKCLNIAIQAPSGSNRQYWHFQVVTNAEKRAKVGEFYRKAWYSYIGHQLEELEKQSTPTDPEEAQMLRVHRSGKYLADHIHAVPVLVIPCIEGRPEDPSPLPQTALYGSILPAAWSFMLALRARGLGSCWTALHLVYEQDVADLLNIPDNITQAALLPVAYFKGTDFKPAKRRPAKELTYWDSWGERR
jgi:nitroreductase